MWQNSGDYCGFGKIQAGTIKLGKNRNGHSKWSSVGLFMCIKISVQLGLSANGGLYISTYSKNIKNRSKKDRSKVIKVTNGSLNSVGSMSRLWVTKAKKWT